jgi:hypothetical protein
MESSEFFKTELATYEREKERLLSENEGRYVVIRGDDILGVWDTYEDAIKAGYEKAKLEKFFVKQIQGIEKILHFTRDLAVCRS